MEENIKEIERRHSQAISYWQERDRESRYKLGDLREKSKAKSFASLLGGLVLGSLLTAYCWVPSNMSVRDINGDGRTDVAVQQMNGVERNYLQEQDGAYKLDTNYLDDMLTITPW